MLILRAGGDAAVDPAEAVGPVDGGRVDDVSAGRVAGEVIEGRAYGRPDGEVQVNLDADDHALLLTVPAVFERERATGAVAHLGEVGQRRLRRRGARRAPDVVVADAVVALVPAVVRG